MDFFNKYDTYIWGIGLVLGTWIYYKYFRRKDKEISCRIENISVIWKSQPAVPSQLKILYEDVPVGYLEVITVSFSNTGNKPILGTDLLDPIVLHLEPNTKILSVNVESTSVKTTHSEKPHSLEFYFDLLNPTDNLKIDITCDRESKIYITNRIIGLTHINFKPIMSRST